MITLYSGTPGSGKSLHAAQDIIRRLRRSGGLITNFPVNTEVVPSGKLLSRCDYWDNSQFSPRRLVDYALQHHVVGREGQTLVVLDEAQLMFNSRDFGRSDRMAWISLFSQHRHLGYNFILIAQHDRMLDRQIRALIETEVRHRKLNNYGFGGCLISLFRLQLFIAIEYWYGGNKLLLSRDFFAYRPKWGWVYDSYKLFADLSFPGVSGSDRGVRPAAALAGEGPPVAGGPPAEAAAVTTSSGWSRQKFTET